MLLQIGRTVLRDILCREMLRGALSADICYCSIGNLYDFIYGIPLFVQMADVFLKGDDFMKIVVFKMPKFLSKVVGAVLKMK